MKLEQPPCAAVSMLVISCITIYNDERLLMGVKAMGLTAGIVGLPNVGKSTLFNAITQAGAESANYPFCTIDPNVGIVEVPDHRLNKLTELVQPKKNSSDCV
ncbi:hypothetical protein GCM10020331_019990 [Ectobacillus funiculus]